MKKFKVLMSLVVMIMVMNCIPVSAAEVEINVENGVTFEELNADKVFIEQSRRGTCTLASSAMVMRRAAMLSGDTDWEDITESSVGSVAWQSGVGISWEFTYHDVTMVHDYVSSTDDLKDLLAEHPEGIVAYDSYTPHAITLTDYDEATDTFYCADPSEYYADGRMPASEAMIDLEDVDVVWYAVTDEELTIVESESADGSAETADTTAASDGSEDIIEITDHSVLTLDKTDFMEEETTKNND